MLFNRKLVLQMLFNRKLDALVYGADCLLKACRFQFSLDDQRDELLAASLAKVEASDAYRESE